MKSAADERPSDAGYGQAALGSGTFRLVPAPLGSSFAREARHDPAGHGTPTLLRSAWEGAHRFAARERQSVSHQLVSAINKYQSQITPAVSALSLFTWIVLAPRIGAAETFRFTAQGLEHQQANWTPQDMEIHRGQHGEEGFLFVLDNPTARTHAFEVPGVREQVVTEHREPITKHLPVKVAPGETVEVHVSFAKVEKDPDPLCTEAVACYRFYCPLHRGDSDPGGIIRVMQ